MGLEMHMHTSELDFDWGTPEHTIPPERNSEKDILKVDMSSVDRDCRLVFPDCISGFSFLFCIYFWGFSILPSYDVCSCSLG